MPRLSALSISASVPGFHKICLGENPILVRLLARSSSQRIIVILVQAMDFLAVETRVSDLHPRAERTDCRKILDREADRRRGRGKATVAEPLPGTTLAL